MRKNCHSDDIFRVQAYFMHVCMHVCTWFCMICGNVAVCMGVFNLLTEDIVLSQESAAVECVVEFAVCFVRCPGEIGIELPK